MIENHNTYDRLIIPTLINESLTRPTYQRQRGRSSPPGNPNRVHGHPLPLTPSRRTAPGSAYPGGVCTPSAAPVCCRRSRHCSCRSPCSAVAATDADKHPPLLLFLLHGWNVSVEGLLLRLINQSQKQLQRRCDDRRNWSTVDNAVAVHTGSHGTTVLWCTWGVPQTNISGIHNGLEGWEALKWGYGVRITMVPSTKIAVDCIF